MESERLWEILKSVLLKKEIKDLDDEIDNTVYKLYGIDEKQRKIIEESETS
jgi:hypothetical protein